APAPASFGSFSADACLGNAGASGTAPMVGISFQFTHMDHNCDLGRQAHDWAAMGDSQMARATLCQTDEAKDAAKALGRDCITGNPVAVVYGSNTYAPKPIFGGN